MNDNVSGRRKLDHDWHAEMAAHDRLPGPLQQFLEYGTAGRYSAVDIMQKVEEHGLDLAADWPKIIRSICTQERQETEEFYGQEHPQARIIAPRTLNRRQRK